MPSLLLCNDPKEGIMNIVKRKVVRSWLSTIPNNWQSIVPY